MSSSGGGAGADGKNRSFFTNKVNAAPFVPGSASAGGSAQGSEGKKGAAGLGSESVNAAPFVPQGKGQGSGGGSTTQQGTASGGAQNSSQRPSSGRNQNAAAFVPKGQRRDGRNQDHDDATAPSTSQPHPPPHHPGRGGYGGRSSPNKMGGRLGPPPPNPREMGMGPPMGMHRGGRGGRGDFGGRGRGRSTYSVAGGMMGGPHGPGGGGMGPGPMGPGYGGMGPVMGVTGTGTSAIPTSRPHEPYMMGFGRASAQLHFIPEALRHQLQQRSYLIQAQWTPESGGGAEDPNAMPDKIQHFHTLCPLEDLANDRVSGALGLRTAVIKAINGQDGQAYALRRVDGKQVIPTSELLTQARQAVEAWTPVTNHPHLVGLRSAFVSSELDSSNSMFFVHDYHPGALTLAQAHLMPSTAANGMVSINTPSEEVLWSYLVQLTSALRSVHSAGLALRPACLHPSKVLCTGFGRIRVNCIGMMEALGGEVDRDDLHHLHRQDLSAVGQLMLTLACVGISPSPSLDVCAAHYSMEFTRIVAALCASADGGQLGSWRQLAGAMADRTMAEMDALSVFNDTTVLELAKECENGRLLRLLIKLGFVNERPDLDGDTQWSETGDRYLLKLFRDFVFHQYSEEGGPLTDWGHVIEALNKLDAGVPEKVLLMSRDEQSMLVVSYNDVKRCMEGSYMDLKQAARGARQRVPHDYS